MWSVAGCAGVLRVTLKGDPGSLAVNGGQIRINREATLRGLYGSLKILGFRRGPFQCGNQSWSTKSGPGGPLRPIFSAEI